MDNLSYIKIKGFKSIKELDLEMQPINVLIINQKLTIVVITVKITRQITQIISQNMWLIIQRCILKRVPCQRVVVRSLL
jgi:hypothetical protein